MCISLQKYALFFFQDLYLAILLHQAAKLTKSTFWRIWKSTIGRTATKGLTSTSTDLANAKQRLGDFTANLFGVAKSPLEFPKPQIFWESLYVITNSVGIVYNCGLFVKGPQRSSVGVIIQMYYQLKVSMFA